MELPSTFDEHPVSVSTAQLLGSLYIANYTQKILKLDAEDSHINEVADAPKARFIAPFADRVVAAYIDDTGGDGILPFGLRWCINSDPTDWSGLGSGSENLIQSPSDTGDQITGIFNYGNLLVLFRERSIWHVTRQPFALAPFRFDAIITNQGCDMPWSIAPISNEEGRPTGFLFGDSRTNGIFAYSPGQRPIRLPASRRVEDQLFRGIVGPETVRGEYDPFFQEYHIGFPTDPDHPENLQKFWVVSLQNNSISLDEHPGQVWTSINAIQSTSRKLTIQELSGNIDFLIPFIDLLGVNPTLSRGFLVRGNLVGEALQEDEFEKGDHEFIWVSQNLSSATYRVGIKKLILAVSASSSGNVRIQWSRDGVSWITLRREFDIRSMEKIVSKKGTSIKKGKMYWRVIAKATQFKMYEWWAKLKEGGPNQSML